MPALPTAADKRASKRSLLPLSAMALAFFVPSYRACSNDPLFSAAQFASGGLLEAAWVSPVFLGAALFAALTALALRAGQVSRRVRRLGLAALAVLSLSTVVSGAISLGAGWDWRWLVAPLACSVAAGAVVRRARGHAPFQIWEHLVGAYVVLAMGTAPAIIFTGEFVAGGHTRLGPGAWLFAAAHAALALIVGQALWRARKMR